MRSIEITTTQNVTIEYELAELRDRILAYVLDSMILGGAILVMLMLLAWISPGSIETLAYFTIFPMFFFYTLAWEIFNNGQTPGKKALGIKIVKVNGKQPVLTDYMLRWSLRMVDIYGSFGAIALMLISSSSRNQRIGDLLSGTILIKLTPSRSFALNDIKRINTLANYEPVYPQVRKLNEKDVLLIKSVAERYVKYPNEAHRRLLSELTEKICADLEIEMPAIPKEKFLKTLISDYIVLTR